MMTECNYTYDNGQNLIFYKSQNFYRNTLQVSPCSNKAITHELFSVYEPSKQQNFEKLAKDHLLFDPCGNQLKTANYGNFSYDFSNNLQSTRTRIENTTVTSYNIFGISGKRNKQITEIWNDQGNLIYIYTVDYLKSLAYYKSYQGTQLEFNGEIVTENGQEITPFESYCSKRILETHRQIAQINVSTAQEEDTNTMYQNHWCLDDNLGSISLQLDKMALGLAYSGYSPYGKTSKTRGKDETQKQGYSGETVEKNKTLAYGYRSYLPTNYRWSQPDPAKFVDGYNKYQFVKGNPLTYRDYKGKMSFNDFLKIYNNLSTPMQLYVIFMALLTIFLIIIALRSTYKFLKNSHPSAKEHYLSLIGKIPENMELGGLINEPEEGVKFFINDLNENNHINPFQFRNKIRQAINSFRKSILEMKSLDLNLQKLSNTGAILKNSFGLDVFKTENLKVVENNLFNLERLMLKEKDKNNLHVNIFNFRSYKKRKKEFYWNKDKNSYPYFGMNINKGEDIFVTKGIIANSVIEHFSEEKIMEIFIHEHRHSLKTTSSHKYAVNKDVTHLVNFSGLNPNYVPILPKLGNDAIFPKDINTKLAIRDESTYGLAVVSHFKKTSRNNRSKLNYKLTKSTKVLPPKLKISIRKNEHPSLLSPKTKLNNRE